MRRHHLISLSLSFLLAACSGTGRIDVGVSSSSALESEGAPAAERKLLVTVDRVEAHVGSDDVADEGDDAGKTEASADDDSWITLYQGPTEIDLAAATTAEAFLGGADVPPGKVTQVRIILAGEATLVEGETRTTVACPSCTQTGIKIVPHGNLSVAEGETLHLNVVFDTLASLAVALDGTRLSPVVRLDVEGSAE